MGKVELHPVGVVARDDRVLAEPASKLLEIALVEQCVPHLVPALASHVQVVVPWHLGVLVDVATEDLGGVHLVVGVAMRHERRTRGPVARRLEHGVRHTKARVARCDRRCGLRPLALERPRELPLDRVVRPADVPDGRAHLPDL